MTKKNALLILIVVALIAAFVVAYIVFFTGRDFDATQTPTIRPAESDSGYFPIVDTQDPADPQTQDTSPALQTELPQLRQIASVPVAGFTTFDRMSTTTSQLPIDRSNNTNDTSDTDDESDTIELEIDTTETIYRYVERATGHIYEASARKPGSTRITNTTIPKIYEAIFFDSNDNDGDSKGDGVVLRYLDQNALIESFVGRVTHKDPNESANQSTSTSTADSATSTTSDSALNSNSTQTGDESTLADLVGTFLPKNISTITKSATSNRFFYTDNGAGYTFTATSPQNQTQILTSPITEWSVEWPTSQLVLTTKPSAGYEGIVFTLNPNGGSLREILDDKNGLTAKMSPDGSRIMFSQNINNEISSNIFETDSKETSQMTLSTLSEKCTWSKNNSSILYCAVPQNLGSGNYPDIWYQGLASFDDALFKINFSDDTVDKIESLTGNFDMIDMQLSEDEDYLVFKNKKDLTLWSLDLR